MSVYTFSLTNKGETIQLEQYRGKVLLIVNVASKCGFTKQYEGLEALYKAYGPQGLEIIGIPSNEFGEEEPGSNEQIQSFCTINYGVTFPIMEKSLVRSEGKLPLYDYLTEAQPFRGFGDDERGEKLRAYIEEYHPEFMADNSIKWNFTKFLVSRQGQVLHRFESPVEPKAMEAAIQVALQECE